MKKIVLRLIALMLCAGSALPSMSFAFDAGLLQTPLTLNGRQVVHKREFISLLPGETLSVVSPVELNAYRDQNQIATEQYQIHLEAVTAGSHKTFKFENAQTKEVFWLELFVMRPASDVQNQRLNGYRIGTYPAPLKGLDAYKAPRGYIEISNADMLNIPVSPHFKVGEFMCKQESNYPKYLVLRPKLLQKLELLLAEVNEQGINAPSFVIMSGYRTPFYNKAIGNVANSRHVYGGAADIYIDVQPRDGIMDDINGDGVANLQDASKLYLIADAYVQRSGRSDLRGGVGQYKKNAAHGPFVHVDVRGTRARWGH